MNYKNILVHVEEEDGCERTVSAAIRLAEQHDAHLSGAYITPYSDMPTYVESRLPAKLLGELEKLEEKKVQAAEAVFVKQCDAAGISYTWLNPKGEVVPELIALSHYSDVIVVSQNGSIRESRVSHHVESSVVLGSARPVLVVPYIGAAKTIGKRVLVAWNESREATRAVNDAMPLLISAEFVEVMTITETQGAAYRPVEMAHYLARHGVSCEASNVARGDLSPAHHILNRATDHDMDCIVMGAYGHSRLRELVLGGDSRSMLQQMTVPVLMSH